MNGRMGNNPAANHNPLTIYQTDHTTLTANTTGHQNQNNLQIDNAPCGHNRPHPSGPCPTAPPANGTTNTLRTTLNQANQMPV